MGISQQTMCILHLIASAFIHPFELYIILIKQDCSLNCIATFTDAMDGVIPQPVTVIEPLSELVSEDLSDLGDIEIEEIYDDNIECFPFDPIVEEPEPPVQKAFLMEGELEDELIQENSEDIIVIAELGIKIYYSYLNC